MIIIRTPLRISIAGGGTDLPQWYKEHGSMFISAAINKYIYITLQKSSYNRSYNLRYSCIEDVQNIGDIKHDIIRETFRYHKVGAGIALTSHADIPSGTGLGSSGSFSIGLLHALFPRETPIFIANEASRIQVDILKYPIGAQDQLTAIFGGINSYKIEKGNWGYTSIMPIKMDYKLFLSKLVMFYTGVKRDANTILTSSTIKGLEEIQNIAYRAKDALQGDFDAYGALLDEHWEHKKKRHPEMSNPEIDALYALGKENGALGGKLIGAGGGGFLLFYTNERDRLIRAMPLLHQPFDFDFEGSKIIYND